MITVERVRQDNTNQYEYVYTLVIPSSNTNNHVNGTRVTLTHDEAQDLFWGLVSALGLKPQALE